jgi:hypothetical protein
LAPKYNTNPNTFVESPGWPQISTLLTETEDVKAKTVREWLLLCLPMVWQNLCDCITPSHEMKLA